MTIAFFRTIILYLLIIVGIRLMGKRQVGELEPSELVLALIIADLAAVPMQDFGIPLLFGIIPILTLLCITMILSVLTMKSIRFRALVCGRPSIVIHDGVLQQREMRKNRLTLDELNEELRLNGILDIASVRYGILETNGRLSTILFPAAQPVTAEQMNLSPGGSDLPSVIINDGRLMSRNLHAAGNIQCRNADGQYRTGDTGTACCLNDMREHQYLVQRVGTGHCPYLPVVR